VVSTVVETAFSRKIRIAGNKSAAAYVVAVLQMQRAAAYLPHPLVCEQFCCEQIFVHNNFVHKRPPLRCFVQITVNFLAVYAMVCIFTQQFFENYLKL
jgi:hypothetical protein